MPELLRPNGLCAQSGNVAIAVVYAALKSIEQQARAVRVADVIAGVARNSYSGAAMLFGRALSSRAIACDCTTRPARRNKN